MIGVFTQGTPPVAVDPTTVALSVKAPNGTVTTYTYALAEIIKDSTGNYHKDLPISAAGTYRYRWTSTGTGQASEESWFVIRQRAVA